ncbi:MAG TPA: agmatinase [Candidatus Altiarchaeales archaeon]|nr:agmatinase [Candidatus Altiarchaeales archaeon]
MSGFNFGGLEPPFSDYKKAKFAVLPVPYERTTSYVQGTAYGPAAIIEASANMELYDEELDFTPAESGIATFEDLVIDAPPEEMVDIVDEHIARILQDRKIPVMLGGEHSITVGAVQAVRRRHPGVSVLQLDAHTDLRDEYEGSRYNHACVMARVREMAPCVQAGIRSSCAEEAECLKKFGDTIFHARRILKDRNLSEIVGSLSDEVYITLDLDVFDPSIMPSVGTPEPGGLGWYDVLELLERVCAEKTVVGFDVVELCPNPQSVASDFTAAKIAYKLMGLRI